VIVAIAMGVLLALAVAFIRTLRSPSRYGGW
jgi:hypothetical protein